MQVVFLCCCNGNISSVLCRNMLRELHKERITAAYIEDVVKSYEHYAQQYDLVLAYGSVDMINAFHLRTLRLAQYVNQIWICPQARYQKANIERQLKEQISVHVVDMQAFGKADHSSILAAIRQSLLQEQS